MLRRVVVVLSVSAGLLASNDGLAQGFVIEQRDLTVDSERLHELVGDALYGEAPTDAARRVFALPLEPLLDDAEGGVEAMHTTVYFMGPRVRMETAESIVTMDLESGLIRIIDPGSRTYFEWSQSDQEALQSSVQELMDQYADEEGYDVGEAEDAYDEDFSGDLPEDTDEEGGVAVGSGVEATINGWSVRSHESASEGTVELSWCASADAATVDLFRRLAESAAVLAEDEEEPSAMEAASDCDGIPIREQVFDAASMTYSVSDVLSIEQKTVDESLFAVPAGFTKVASPF